MPIKACQGCLKDMFLTTTEAIDCFTGKQLWGWGGAFGTFGSPLGDGVGTDRVSPVQTISGGTNWKQVSASGFHTAAIKTDGTLWTFGYGGLGALGNNSTASQLSPVQTISGGTNWKQVSASGFHTAAIKTDGTLWVWGAGSGGNLGNNSIINRSSPVQTVSTEENWKQVSAGSYITSAIKTDGTLWIWGRNQFGQLGDNTLVNKSSPVQTTSSGTNWKQVSAGQYNIGAIKTDGTLWIWGRNQFGQLGRGDTISRSSPAQTVSGGTNWNKISTSVATAAIKTDGTLWLWGWNTAGQLGDNTVVNKSSPVQTVAGGLNWLEVSAGLSHTSAIKTDGSLWNWGCNSLGGLGDNTVVNKSSPVQTVAFGFNWKQTSAGTGDNTMLAIKEVEF